MIELNYIDKAEVKKIYRLRISSGEVETCRIMGWHPCRVGCLVLAGKGGGVYQNQFANDRDYTLFEDMADADCVGEVIKQKNLEGVGI